MWKIYTRKEYGGKWEIYKEDVSDDELLSHCRKIAESDEYVSIIIEWLD